MGVIQLAFGAFDLFNPVQLGQEPLRALFRAIGRLDAKDLRGNESVLRIASEKKQTELLEFSPI